MPGDDLFDGISASSDTGLFSGIEPAKGSLFEGIEMPQETQLSTAIGRKQADIANIQENIAKLQAIEPASADQAARIQAMIRRLKGSLDGAFVYGNESNRGAIDNLTRGITAGVSKGLLLGGADLLIGAKNLAIAPIRLIDSDFDLPGAKAFERQVEEAKQNIQEVTDPEGLAGTIGDFTGTIIGSAPAYGTAAELTGEKIVAKFPGSKIGKAIKAATEGGASRASRAIANVATGLPINIGQGLSAGNQEITADMSPEEREAIERENRADKAKNMAIGILADALFGFALPGKKTPEGKKEPPKLPPEREAQLRELKAKADRRVAEKAKRDQRRQDARTEWAQQNPGKLWKDLGKAERAKIYENYNIKKDAEEAAQQVGFLVDDEPATTTAPNPDLDKEKADMRKQIVDLNNRLKAEETRRNEIERQAKQDPLMGIGNGRALKQAVNRVDTDPNLVWIFFDSNGMKSINDTFGHETGDKMLLGNRDALIRALREYGIEVDPEHAGNIFRPSEGGDELVAAVPRDKAQSILQKAEEYSNQQFDNLTGNMSGAIYDTYAEGMSVEGNARLQSRKIASKAKYNIPGRNAEEQALIDAVKKEMSESLADESGAQGPGAVPRVEGLEPTSRFEPPSENVAPTEAIQGNEPPTAIPPEKSADEKAIDALIETSRTSNIPEALSKKDLEALPDDLLVQGLNELQSDIVKMKESGASPELIREAEQQLDGFRQEYNKRSNEQQKRNIEESRKEYYADVTEKLAGFSDDDLQQILDGIRSHIDELDRIGGSLEDKALAARQLDALYYEINRRAAPQDKQAVEDLLSQIERDFPPRPNEDSNLPAPQDAADESRPATSEPAPTQESTRGAPEELTPTEEPSTAGTRPGSKSELDEIAPQNKTFLESFPHKKPLEELTERQLDKLDDKVMKAIEKADPNSEEYKKLQRDLDKLMMNQRRLNEEAKAAKAAPPPKEEGPVDFSGPEQGSGPKAIEESNRLLGEHARTLMRKSLRTMNIEDLKLHVDDLQSRLNGMTVMEGKEYRDRLDKALQELAERHKGDQGFSARIPPGVGGAGLGFAYGYMKNPGEDEDRMTNALEWALVGAAAGSLTARMLRRGTAPRLTVPENRLPSELPGGQWQAEARKTIVHNPERGKKPIPFLERIRNIYRGIARNTYAAERFQQSLGASRLSTEYNAAKQFGMFGRYTGQTESALRYGPAIYDEFGNAKKLDAKGIGDILDMVDGDAESLGDLMAALTTLEQAGKVKNPMPLHVADRLIHAMSENFHLAAAEARKFSLAMAQVGVDGGLLSPEIVARFATENFYAPMIRIFGLSAEKLKSAEPEKVIAGAASPFKARKGGSTKAVLSPFQSMVDMIPRIYRATELNKIKNLWVDAWEAAGKPEHLMTRISKDDIKLSGMHEAKIKQIQNELAVSRADAERLVAGLEPTMIDPLSGTMRLYRNGNLESYRIPKELAEAVINLNPEDMHILTKVLGLPSRAAVKGITMHPFFVAKMAFFDMWQATLNSQYGFRFGVDNIRGFLHAALDSKEYRNFLAAGGQHQALYGPSKSNFSTAISDIKAHKGSALGVAFRQTKQLKPVDAWKTLVTPISDAARIGEYLRAKDHGASDIEAVYAAKVVTANYNEIGSWGAMRGLQHMTMFLGPAIQVLDQATYRAGIHPFRRPEEGRLAAAANYGLKAFVSIALPSWYFWHAYKDDEEINDLRKTSFGSKYWWMRGTDGQVIRIPKPPVDGQIFGTTLEGLLDKYKEGDPHGMDRISGAVLRDAAFNILPTIGVIPYSLETNTNLGLGFPIVPEGDRDLALQYQGADKATWLAREVSKKVAPLAEGSSSQAIRTGATPAGIDFLINSVTGMLGQDISLGVSQAIEQEQTGYVPAKDEYPIIKRVLVHVPTENVASVQRFYETAEKAQTVGATVDYLIRHDPDKVLEYAQSNQYELAILPVYSKVRQQIANYHRTIVDIKNAPANVISPSDKRLYIEQLKTEIVKMARLVNSYSLQAEARYGKETSGIR